MNKGKCPKKKCKDWFVSRDMSVIELAKLLSVTPDYIYKIFRNDRRPSPELALIISKLTGISLENILFPKKKDLKIKISNKNE